MTAQVRVAIIGSGWGVKVQYAAFKQAGLQVAALWCRSEDKVEGLKSQFKEVELITSDYARILAEPSIQLISITTPPHLHRDMSIQALKAGKHVMCDKPTCLNRAEAQDMCHVAAEYPNQLALIDHELRYLLPYIRARELVAEGAVGSVVRTDIVCVVVPSGPANAWWWDASLGGGLLGALGSHCFDLAQYLTSDTITALHCVLDITQPQRVTRENTTVTVSADDYMNIQFRTAKNSLGTVTGIYRPFGTSSMTITIYGSEGIITCVDGKMSWHKNNGRLVEERVQPSAPTELPDTIWAAGSVEIGKAIKRALETNDLQAVSRAAPFSEGLAIQTLLDAARQSHSTRQWIQL